jgi:hypothetical protein
MTLHGTYVVKSHTGREHQRLAAPLAGGRGALEPTGSHKRATHVVPPALVGHERDGAVRQLQGNHPQHSSGPGDEVAYHIIYDMAHAVVRYGMM